MYDALPLKDYQQKVLEAVEKYLDALNTCRQRAIRNYERDIEDKIEPIDPENSQYCSEAWEKLKTEISIPRYRDKKSRELPNSWLERKDGIGRQIPNVCLKVPTGGGKTLLAACALQRINHDYFKKNTGLILWVVPSDTIFKQTWAALTNKEHAYRKQLDIASGGCTKIFKRGDKITLQDVDNNLCVMLLMLQSFNIKGAKKEARKIYNDSGNYQSFFPLLDDYNANNELINEIPNLVEGDMLGRDVISGISIKHSLGNVFRICRPIVVVDEEHKAKSQQAIDNINDFNPRFILELSATPRDTSNKLVDVGGQDLKQEQMIKLPINVKTSSSEDWRNTLELAHKKLASLNKDAAKLQGETGTYIRPIMVIIAEPKKKGDRYDHVEDIKKYLTEKCQVIDHEIRIKLSENDEIKNEDLLDKLCPVKYIITKDALREGWDCPFAYVLTILTKKDSKTALTQYTGRVLRQPYARVTPIASLNESYIFCSQQDVSDAVAKIKEGLEREGMGDVANDITGSNDDNENTREKVTLKRNGAFTEKIFLPKLNTVLGKGKISEFDYYRDILGEIDWSKYSFDSFGGKIVISDKTSIDTGAAIVDYNEDMLGQGNFRFTYGDRETAIFSEEINLSLLTSQLTDKIPNPFEARRILDEVIKSLKKIYKQEVIAASGHDITRQVKDNAFEWLLKESESLFVQKLKVGEVILKLLASPFIEFNWPMGEERVVYRNHNEIEAKYEKNIFQPQYKSSYNGLERDVAIYINENEAVQWWHRLGVKGTEYHVQGWKKDKIYPDFLIYHSNDKYILVETKGNHLENPDSKYKAKVFDYLNRYNAVDIGEFKLLQGDKELSFNLVYEDEWKKEMIKIGV